MKGEKRYFRVVVEGYTTRSRSKRATDKLTGQLLDRAEKIDLGLQGVELHRLRARVEEVVGDFGLVGDGPWRIEKIRRRNSSAPDLDP